MKQQWLSMLESIKEVNPELADAAKKGFEELDLDLDSELDIPEGGEEEVIDLRDELIGYIEMLHNGETEELEPFVDAYKNGSSIADVITLFLDKVVLEQFREDDEFEVLEDWIEEFEKAVAFLAEKYADDEENDKEGLVDAIIEALETTVIILDNALIED